MNRTIAGLVGLAAAAATLGLDGIDVSRAAPPDRELRERTVDASYQQLRPDNRPDAKSRHYTALRREAVRQLLEGTARTVGRGERRTIEMASGDRVEYPVQDTAQLLTFLVEYGDQKAAGDPFPSHRSGPLHNRILEPPANDDATYWLPDFNREHYLDMFFTGLDDQGGESFAAAYREMSSGRFTLEGDVSDWVKVPFAASHYSLADGGEPDDLMTEFLQDGADAWVAQQSGLGKTDAEIADFLSAFDVWDRFDFDEDGNFKEPDGYIDHFQAVHAGEDESAGAPPWAIWAHRGSVNANGRVGPDFNRDGGVEIGDTGFWIRDYTVEPENGGIGIFAHEFGHDLGLPDYYDTQGGNNGTGFWTLMSVGSWLGHGAGDIGTTPNHMGAPDKLFLGWYDDDLAVVDGTGAPQIVDLGPSYHATDQGAQAVAVTLPQGHAILDVVEPDQGSRYFYSGMGNDRTATVTSPTAVAVPATEHPMLTARVSFSTEDDWDYAYLKVSTDDGVSWDYVDTNLSTETDPNERNFGHGITGCSGTRTPPIGGVCDLVWTDLSADLAAYAGQHVKVRFELVNDESTYELGFAVDDIRIDGSVLTDVEDGAPSWVLRGFRVMTGSSYAYAFDRFYIAENKQPMGYEKVLAEGPYSLSYDVSASIDRVDHFPYQDGLLIWYVNTFYEDNDTSVHPGQGYALPVDANPVYRPWTSRTGAALYYSDGTLNTRDATFDVDQMDALHLEADDVTGTIYYDARGGPSVPVFDDSNPNGYVDLTWVQSPWYSVQVAGVGSMIQVLSSDETTGHMVVKAGTRFVAMTGAAAVTGLPVTGQTLTAMPPSYFRAGVAASYQWQVGGRPISGAPSPCRAWARLARSCSCW
ncbi:MAG TPA: immune inhibitor A, partial [Nocardioides sp.]|nr:immune inhibitor A [Nocardioides sp.]